jgi:C_GCAxxG_C_C family probable redox protein
METNTDMRSLVKDYAIENYKSGLNCAECVFEALQRSGALPAPPETIAMCVGFGGGIGLSGYTCGALSGAVMALGAVHGRHDPKAVDPAIRGDEIARKYYRRYNKLVRDFEQAMGGVLCRDITGPYEDWHSKERRVCCLKLIGEAAAIAYDNLMIPQEEAFVLPYGENMAGLE